MKTLEEILKKYFGLESEAFPDCEPQRDSNGDWIQSTLMTDDGWKAYSRLTDLIYDLEGLGVIEIGEANDIMETLDDIVKHSY